MIVDFPFLYTMDAVPVGKRSPQRLLVADTAPVDLRDVSDEARVVATIQPPNHQRWVGIEVEGRLMLSPGCVADDHSVLLLQSFMSDVERLQTAGEDPFVVAAYDRLVDPIRTPLRSSVCRADVFRPQVKRIDRSDRETQMASRTAEMTAHWCLIDGRLVTDLYRPVVIMDTSGKVAPQLMVRHIDDPLSELMAWQLPVSVSQLPELLRIGWHIDGFDAPSWDFPVERSLVRRVAQMVAGIGYFPASAHLTAGTSNFLGWAQTGDSIAECRDRLADLANVYRRYGSKPASNILRLAENLSENASHLVATTEPATTPMP